MLWELSYTCLIFTSGERARREERRFQNRLEKILANCQLVDPFVVVRISNDFVYPNLEVLHFNFSYFNFNLFVSYKIQPLFICIPLCCKFRKLFANEHWILYWLVVQIYIAWQIFIIDTILICRVMLIKTCSKIFLKIFTFFACINIILFNK